MLRKDGFARVNSRRLVADRLKLDRRALSLPRLLAFFAGIFLATIVTAGTITYTYDALGRLTLANLDDGSSVKYNLDKAGNRISVATYPPFTAPTGLTATPVSATSMTLSWSAASGGSGGYTYNVYSSTGSLIASPTTTGYTQTGLAVQSSHSYYVVAVDSDGSISPQSAVAFNTTYAMPTIGSFTGAPNSDSSITVSWAAADANGPGLQPFSLTRTPGPLNASPAATAINFTDSGLTPGTPYTYTLVASDGKGDTVSSTAIIGTDPLPAINSFTALPASSTVNTLTWTGSDTTQQGAITYRVVRGSTALSCTASPCPDTGLAPGTLYSYTLTATDALSEMSTGSASSRTYPLPTASLSLSSVTSTSATLAWSVGDSGGPGLSSVLITRAGVTKYSNAESGSSASGTYTETGLAPNNTYTYSLISHDTASDASAASTVSATTQIGTFQFLGGTHSFPDHSGDNAVATIQNSGTATITGIVAVTNNGSFLCNNISPTTLAPGATGTVSCSAFVATSNPASITLTGTSVSNSGVVYSW